MYTLSCYILPYFKEKSIDVLKEKLAEIKEEHKNIQDEYEELENGYEENKDNFDSEEEYNEQIEEIELELFLSESHIEVIKMVLKNKLDIKM